VVSRFFEKTAKLPISSQARHKQSGLRKQQARPNATTCRLALSQNRFEDNLSFYFI